MSRKWIDKEKTKNWQTCQLNIYILRSKEVVNLSTKKYVPLSCCGSPIRMIFLEAAEENIWRLLCVHAGIQVLEQPKIRSMQKLTWNSLFPPLSPVSAGSSWRTILRSPWFTAEKCSSVFKCEVEHAHTSLWLIIKETLKNVNETAIQLNKCERSELEQHNPFLEKKTLVHNY